MGDQLVPQRVFLHVGAPKTGTTFLQTVLWDHRDALRQYGVLFPGEHYDDHFFAAVDLQQLDFHGEPRPEAAGAWERVAAAARDWPGTTVISHDVFAGATAAQAGRALADLAPAEMHVVCTVRDRGRQLPSHWQEDVKHGSTERLGEWYDAISRHDQERWAWRWFWQTEELPDVLSRWGANLPPEHVHVVTVPPEGSPRAELWRRFCSVVGIDPAVVDLDTVSHPNTSLGVAEAELLRRVNVSLDGAFSQVVYEHVVKGVFAHETLTRRSGRRVVAPAEAYDAAAATGKEWIDEINRRGIDVVGELDDLVPAPVQQDGPAEASEAEVAAAAAWAAGEVLRRLEDERLAHQAELRGLHDELARTRDELVDAHARLRRIDQHPLVRLRFRLRRLPGRARPS